MKQIEADGILFATVCTHGQVWRRGSKDDLQLWLKENLIKVIKQFSLWVKFSSLGRHCPREWSLFRPVICVRTTTCHEQPADPFGVADDNRAVSPICRHSVHPGLY